MFIKFIISLMASVLLLSTAFAENAAMCPDAEQTRNLQFNQNNWQAFTIDNGTPISFKALPAYVAHVTDNKLAEYIQNAPEGPSHCYYSDANLDWAPFYLVSTIELLPRGKSWHYLSDSIWQCDEHADNRCVWRYVAE